MAEEPKMQTIEDNIMDLGRLARKLKTEIRFSESSVLRLIDMGFAIAQQTRNMNPNFPPEYADIADIIPGADETPAEEE